MIVSLPVPFWLNGLPSKRLSRFQNSPKTQPYYGPCVHPLFIIKTINSALSSGKEVETVSSVRTGKALLTTTDDLLRRSKEKITKAEVDERWVIVLVHPNESDDTGRQ